LWDTFRARVRPPPRAELVVRHIGDSAAILADTVVTRAMAPVEGRLVNLANGLRNFALAQAARLDDHILMAERFSSLQPTMADMAANFGNVVVFTPIFEEVLRTLAPKCAFVYLAILEPLMKLAVWGPASAALSAVFHCVMSLFATKSGALPDATLRNVLKRTAVHMIWNGAAFFHAVTQVSQHKDARSLRYLSALSSLLGPDVARVVTTGLGSYWLAKTGRWTGVPQLRPEAEESFKATLNGEKMELAELGPALESYSHDGYEEQGKTFPLITPTVLKNPSKKAGHPKLVREDRYCFVQPSRSPLNLLLCMVHRTLADPRAAPNPGLWADIHNQWRALMYEGYFPEKRYTFAEAVAKMDPLKRARLVNAMRTMDRDGRLPPHKVSISVKHNEVIMRRTGMGVKPRAIVQCPPELIADSTAEIHGVSEAMHFLWHPSMVHELEHVLGFRVPVRFIYASGYTAYELDIAFEKMLGDEVSWYWMAGDDNMTCLRVPELGLTLYYEGDFSMYDSTQGPEALAGDLEDMETMGFDAVACGLDCLGRELPFRVSCVTKHIDLRVSFALKPMQASGLPSTTCGNTSRHAKNGFHTIRHVGVKTPSDAAAELGFLLKVREHEQITDATFLKGWWCLFQDGAYHWLPLPSMTLKLAKMLRHPSDIFPRRPRRGCIPQVSVCARELAWADTPRVPDLGRVDLYHVAPGPGERCGPGPQEESHSGAGALSSDRSGGPPGQDVSPVWNRRVGGARSGGCAEELDQCAGVVAWFSGSQEAGIRLCLIPAAAAGTPKKLFEMQVEHAINPRTLKPGDIVRDANGDVVFRVDPSKKKNSDAQIRKAVRAQKAQRLLPAPKKSVRTKEAREKLVEVQRKRPKQRARGVVKHDFGIADRTSRVQKRVQVLTKRARSRRRSRRRRGASVRPSRQEEAWDRELARQHQEQKDASWENAPQAEGESWWGGILDTALDLAPHVIPLIAGMGDYEEDDLANQVLPRTNSLAAAFSDGEMCAEVPAIHNIGAETRFTHREYIGDVYSTTSSFSKVEFAVNPGMNEVFPWGSRSILNYEQYSLLGAMFCFESEASDYTAAAGMGWVALSSTYDVSEAAFYSKKDMFQSQFAVARKPSKNFCHWIECDPSILVLPKKFVRGGPVPTGTDVHLYDHCRTTLAVGGQAAPNIGIGELWITYDLLAMLPRTDESLGAVGIFAEVQSTAGVTQATPYGTAWTFTTRDTIAISMTSSTMTLPASFPAADLYFVETWSGTAAIGNASMPAFTGANEAIIATLVNMGNGAYPASNGPANMGRWSYIITSGNPALAPSWSIATNQLTGPTGLTFRGFLVQVPKFRPEANPIFDRLGLESERRYLEFRAAMDKEKEVVVPARETPNFSLVPTRDPAWFSVVDRATDRRVVIDASLARTLSVASVRCFDLLCADAIAHPDEKC